MLNPKIPVNLNSKIYLGFKQNMKVFLRMEIDVRENVWYWFRFKLARELATTKFNTIIFEITDENFLIVKCKVSIRKFLFSVYYF
jgi:hypothetical protein